MFLFSRVSCSTESLWTHCRKENGLKLPVLLPPHSRHRDYQTWVPRPSIFFLLTIQYNTFKSVSFALHFFLLLFVYFFRDIFQLSVCHVSLQFSIYISPHIGIKVNSITFIFHWNDYFNLICNYLVIVYNANLHCFSSGCPWNLLRATKEAQERGHTHGINAIKTSTSSPWLTVRACCWLHAKSYQFGQSLEINIANEKGKNKFLHLYCLSVYLY